MRCSVASVIVPVVLLVGLAAPSLAANPGRHPAYLHALSDLRDARAHLERLGSERVDHKEERAIAKIDTAINEIKHAAIDDGKDINDHVFVDAQLARAGRFHKALELLDKAKEDVSREEDQADTRGLQLRVIHHIDEARKEVRRVIETALNHA
jgi:tetratricopeptide (TPR) repeat protein